MSGTSELIKAVGIDPANATAHLRLADAYATEGRFVEAVAEFRSALCLGEKSQGIRRRIDECAKAAAAKRPADTISHNIYFRTQWLAREIRRLLPGKKFSLLDAGGGDGRLAMDLPMSDYVLAEPDTNGIFVTESLTLNRTFDCVACCHVLEHIPVEQRDAFLDALCRMATQYVLILNPVVDDHTNLQEWQQLIFDLTGAHWAKEHIDCVMPRLEEITSYATRRGYAHTVKPNGSKALSLAVFFFDHYSRNGAAADVAKINRMFNAIALDDLDHAEWPNAYLIAIDVRNRSS